MHAGAEAAEATVQRVVDGDTVWVAMHDDDGLRAGDWPGAARGIKLRILGIDAPEICQPHGRAARRFLENWILDRPVLVEGHVRDRYGRLLVRLQAEDGRDVASVMVREGHAWSLRSRWRGAYAAEETAARMDRAGLFADPDAVYPATFRASHGPCPYPPRRASRQAP